MIFDQNALPILCTFFKDQFIEDRDGVRQRRQVNDSTFPEPPHLCYTDSDGATNCKVYTRYSKRISVNVSLYSDELEQPRGQFWHWKKFFMSYPGKSSRQDE